MAGPVPSGAEYGETLKRYKASQREEGVQAAEEENVGPFASSTGDKYGAALERVTELQEMLKTLASRDTNKLMTRGIEKPAPAKDVQHSWAEKQQGWATPEQQQQYWVPQGGEMFGDENTLAEQVGGIATSPEEMPPQEAVVTPETLPEPEMVDPIESAPASVFAGLLGQATSDDVATAKALATDPESREIVRNKGESGAEMGLAEKIAWVAMLVAPAAIGYAMQGEKGALLGGAATGKGMESMGKSMTEQEDAEKERASKVEQLRMKLAADEKEAMIKAAEKKQTSPIREGIYQGQPTLMRIGETAEPVMGPEGVVRAPSRDPVSGEIVTPPPPRTTPTVITETEGGTKEITPPQPMFVAPTYPKATKESVASKLSRLGIGADAFDQEILQMDDAQFAASVRYPGENANDVKYRKEQYEKLQKMIEAKEASGRELAQWAEKEGMTASRAEGKQRFERIKDQYDKGNPWKRNQVILQQADHRQASRYARNDMAEAVDPRTGQTVRSAPWQGMKNTTAQGIDDVGLLYTYIKMLDPGSVVREGEVYMVGAGTPLMAKMTNLYQKIFGGGAALTPNERNYINRLISAKVLGAYSEQIKYENTFQAKAEGMGLNFGLIQDPIIEAELKDINKAKSRAQGIPSIKRSDTEALKRLPVDTVLFLEYPDGRFVPTFKTAVGKRIDYLEY